MAARKPKPPFTYKVTGRGPFPIDMLRYDAAHPTHEVDSAAIGYSFDRGHSARATRTISITGNIEPTVRRWESFGWTVER